MNIYLLHYPKGNKMQYSIGLIKNIDDYTIRHLCDSSGGSSGAPIINSMNFQVIGIHKGGAERGNYNLGTLLKEPLLNFNDKNGLEQIIERKILIEDPDNKRNLICSRCLTNCHLDCDCFPFLFGNVPRYCRLIKHGYCIWCYCETNCHSLERRIYKIIREKISLSSDKK